MKFLPIILFILSLQSCSEKISDAKMDETTSGIAMKENLPNGNEDFVSKKVISLNFEALEKKYFQKKNDSIYVINFWATWCAPCIKEIPYFEKLQQEHKSDQLKVLLVSVDFRNQLESKVMPFVKQRELKNEVFLLDESDQQKFIDRIDKTWSGAIPATLFVKGDKRKFLEKEFTYPTLLNEYQKFK